MKRSVKETKIILDEPLERQRQQQEIILEQKESEGNKFLEPTIFSPFKIIPEKIAITFHESLRPENTRCPKDKLLISKRFIIENPETKVTVKEFQF